QIYGAKGAGNSLLQRGAEVGTRNSPLKSAKSMAFRTQCRQDLRLGFSWLVMSVREWLEELN
ncbi:MAG: hypothetical protein ACI814_001375, partial [Mariniblastus sp.]